MSSFSTILGLQRFHAPTLPLTIAVPPILIALSAAVITLPGPIEDANAVHVVAGAHSLSLASPVARAITAGGGKITTVDFGHAKRHRLPDDIRTRSKHWSEATMVALADADSSLRQRQSIEEHNSLARRQ
jgi:hypothetical protein